MPTFSYPNGPFRRMAYDDDGTVFWWARTSASTYASVLLPGTEVTTEGKEWANNERTLIAAETIDLQQIVQAGQFTVMAMIFTEQRDLYGFNYWTVNAFVDPGDPRKRNYPNMMEVSANSTNGLDGTWTDLFPGSAAAATYPVGAPWETYTWDFWYRVGIQSFTSTGVRAIRWMASVGEGLISFARWHHCHVYGDKSAGATPDRLLFIDEDTGLEFVAPLDWGDVPRGTTLTHDIKVKNNSATLTANDILVDFEALTGDSDTWHALMETGGSFAGTLNITSIAPATEYPTDPDVITIRMIANEAESLGHQACRMQATTTSWT